MSFVIQRPSGRGLALTQLRGDVLRIGRGTNADLRSDNPSVSLEHAVIEGGENAFSITDKGSITGTDVNGRRVETSQLARGDVIDIGDLRIEVQIIEPGKPLFIRVTSTTPPRGSGVDEEAEVVMPGGGGVRGGTVKAPKIDYADAYRLRRAWLTKRSLVAILLIVSFLVVAELAKPQRQTAFMPGGDLSKHARKKDVNGNLIGKNCHACHDPWRGVTDAGCKGCHGKLPHAENQIDEPVCADCHAEHGISKLAGAADATCVSCHGNIRAHVKDPTLLSRLPSDALSITSFGGQHPGFTPRSDPDVLPFSHANHLKAGGIRNAQGRFEILKCVGCHKLVETKEKIDPAPVTFKSSCQRCHDLRFKDRSNAEVPHPIEPGEVLVFLQNEFGNSREIVSKTADERRSERSRPLVSTYLQANIAFEHITKARCRLCHVFDPSGVRIAAKPEMPTRWLFKARFTHTQHLKSSCESCHETARQSTKTSDVLIPTRQPCIGCHGGQAARTAGNCVTCHEYHGRSRPLLTQMTAPGKGTIRAVMGLGGGSGMIETVLLWAIVLLLLVVLVPAGVALFQRIRQGGPDRPAAARRPAAPPVVPLKIPPQVSDAPAAGTEVVPLAPQQEDAGSKTEVVEWCGLLVCTSGVLEGQKFIIEEGKPFWIGRNPSVCRIVLSDKRISSTHVRIVPRAGKVLAVDEESKNGTFLGKAGGERITEVELKSGDTLVLADNVITFLYKL